LNRCFHKRFYLSTAIALIVFLNAAAQSPSFHHITASDGLTDNNIRSIVIDHNNFLWVGTTEGLNVFDGYFITSFKKGDYPEMASDNIIHLTCDSRNRIWLGTPNGITWIDEKRKFHRVVLNDTISKFGSRTIQDTKKYGPILYTSLGQFFLNEKTQKWQLLDWIPGQLKYQLFHDAEPFSENQTIYATDSAVVILDYATKKIIYEQPFTAVFSLCRYSDHEIAIGLEHGEILIVDILTKKIVRKYKLTSELNKKQINTTITEVRPAVNGDLLVGTGFAGLTIITKQGTITNYSHNPFDPRSIAANMTWRVLCSKNGDVIVGTRVAGLSIFNIYEKKAGYTKLFNDDKGDAYDGFFSDMREDNEGRIWIGAMDRLVRWDKKNNKVKFFYYYAKPIWNGGQNIELRSLCFDKKGRVWVAALGDGIAVLNEKIGEFKKISIDSSFGPAVKTNLVVHLYTGSDGYIWVGSTLGFYTIDPLTLKVNTFMDHPLLKKIAGTRVNDFLEDRQGNIWIASFNGVFYYNRSANKLDHYTTEQGLGSNYCYTLTQNKQDDLYVGTQDGFSIISNGKITSYDQKNKLKYDRCEGILEDGEGKMWIANYKCLIKFDPKQKTFQYFDENAGLTAEGFRVGSYLKTSSGELFWGSRTGLNYFYPEKLENRAPSFKVNIYQANIQDSTFFVGGSDNISLKYTDNDIIFHFTAVNLKGSHNIQYQYMLEGYEKQWQTGKDIREARYSSLPPGSYTFQLKASADGLNWINSSNKITVRIIPPIWQRWWFRIACSVFLAAIIFLTVYYRTKKLRRQKEELETEQAINYFASSMHEQQTVDNILWDVARNCIGRLKFEDCVIYLIDEKRNVLMQKAAYGPKSPRQFEIDKPIEIPLGKGIVGSVALKASPEIINDTTKDPRYIVDDAQRYSEISVPIISDGKVLGVIDCEHSRKRFFTQKHLSILITIASLCANKIVRALAEQQKEQAHLKLMDTQRKMTEIEMQALRAQMNPHFIFNCLNSINRYIVKSDQVTASLYLTKFAKLIRLILDNSNNKNIILTNELEALKLYIEMEALRFDKKFDYRITVDASVNTDNIEVPPMIIQPYVENAIWHGLLHKETTGCLCISISLPEENILQCIIEDDGIGREKAKELKSKSAITRKSLGMKLTENRLTLLNKYAELNASVDIIDLKTTNDEAIGTKVILKIPI
jgi:ligand-binding sensor domain-containing protein/putative methionine-R-sulfoxide reductase with GAF domain